MADVFISYSRLDQERVQPIADRLTSLGYTVWRDDHVRTGRAFVEEVERELENASAVLTVWSQNARNSTWVQAESSRALDARKLVQLSLDQAPPPAPFGTLPLADMSNERTPSWGPLEDALAQVVRNLRPVETEHAVAPGMLATSAASGSPKLLTVAAAAIFVAFTGAISATQGGMMTSGQLQVALVGMIGVGGACVALCAHRLLAISRAGG